MANLGPDDVEEKVLDAALRMAQSQATVPPLEEQIAHTTKILKRAKKRLVAADAELQSAVKKKAQCEEEVAEAEADLAKMREEVPLPTDHSERPESRSIEGQGGPNWKPSRVVQSEGQSKQPRASGPRRQNVERCCAEDMLPSTEQELSVFGWTRNSRSSETPWTCRIWSHPVQSQD